jgi:hypothetical protein
MRALHRACPAAVLCLAIATGASAQSAAPSNDDCLACHGDPSAARADGRPVAVEATAFAASTHGAFACVDCHADLATLAELPHAETLAKVDCASCHDAAVSAYNAGVHAQARRGNGGSGAARCVDCHGTHDIRASGDPASRTYRLNLAATCGRCHGDEAMIRKEHMKGGNVLAAFEDGIHGRALRDSGLIVAPSCSDCHGSHDVRPTADPASAVHRTKAAVTCGRCHEGIRTQFQDSIHGQAVAAGHAAAPACQDCHSAHRISRAEDTSWQLGVIAECGTCHAESLATYRDTFHGQVTALGFTRVAKCADCHTAHQILGSDDPRSSVSPAKRLGTCQSCHPDANENFAQYDPHADKHDRARNPALYYASTFMNGLLIGVFGFFGLHTTMWVTRSLRERRRTAPLPTRPAGPMAGDATRAAGEGQPGPKAGTSDDETSGSD